MRKKFVIGVNSLSVEQKKLFKKFVEQDGSGWWNWIEGFWLVDADDDRLTAEKIRDELCELSNVGRILVLEVSPDNWAAYGPETEDKSISKWLKVSWKGREKIED